MNRFWERFFFVFTFIAQGSSYMSARTYGILHRLHHAHTDTEEDPHSPLFSSNALSLMNTTRKKYVDIYNKKIKTDEKYAANLPSWEAFERIAHSWYCRILWVLLYTLFYYYFATAAWMFIFVPLHALMGPAHGAIVNWYAHKYGSVNFEINNTSKNVLWAYPLILGETYHNNHHKFPARLNFGIKAYEIDPFYAVILFFNTVGILKIQSKERENTDIL